MARGQDREESLTLSGKAAIVTGAGNGLGRAEAVALARAGALLVLNDLPGDAVRETAEQIRAAGGQAVVCDGDIADWVTGQRLYARIVNTTSEAFLLGAPGQPNYAAAKAGIAALTVATARGCGAFADSSPDSPGFACMETMSLASETIGFD